MVKITIKDINGVTIPNANVYVTQHLKKLVLGRTDVYGEIDVPIESGEDTMIRVRFVDLPYKFYKPFEAIGNLYENLEVILIEDI